MKTLLSFMVVFCAFSVVQSQTDTLPTDQVEVLKRFNANLEKTEKISFSPSAPPLDTTPRSYSYDFDIIPADVPSEKAQLLYDELALESLFDPYHGILKIGYGIPNQPFALLSYGQNKPATHHWNAQIQHHSFGRNNDFQDYSRTAGTADGGIRLSDDWAVNGSFHSSYRRHQYYPLRLDSLFEESDADRTLLQVRPKVGIGGYLGLWHLEGSVDYHFSKDGEGPKENRALWNGRLSRSWDDKSSFNLFIEGQTGEFVIDTFESKLNFLMLGTGWSKLWRGWSSTIGADLVIGEKTYLLPNIKLGVIAIERLLHLGIYASGEARPLRLSRLLSENPFINPNGDVDAFQSQLNFGATAEGDVEGLHYRFGAEHALHQNQHFFINNSESAHLFDVVTDDATITRLEGRIMYRFSETDNVGVRAKKLFISPENQEKPWHMPTYYFHIFASTGFWDNRFTIHPELRVQGGAAFVHENSSKLLDPIIEMNLDLGYKINEQWSLFIEGDNLLNQSNPQFNLYESIGFRLLTGITYKL